MRLPPSAWILTHAHMHTFHTYICQNKTVYILPLFGLYFCITAYSLPVSWAQSQHKNSALYLCFTTQSCFSLFCFVEKVAVFFFLRVFANHFANRSSLTMRLNSHMSVLQGECHHVKPGKTRVLDVITCELVVNIRTAESCTIFKTFF